MIYNATDESHHIQHCTQCEFVGSMEEHSIIYNATDVSHHISFCVECDFESEEQLCSFEEEGEDQEENKKYCKCGNYITESSGGESHPEDPDPDEDETETGESQEDDLTKEVIEGGVL